MGVDKSHEVRLEVSYLEADGEGERARERGRDKVIRECSLYIEVGMGWLRSVGTIKLQVSFFRISSLL